jgi:hypothetical protein
MIRRMRGWAKGAFGGGGYLTLGRWRGTPVRVHWTAPVGAVVFGRFQFVPVFWFCFHVIVILHEMGHATIVRRFGARPLSLDVHGLGGLCRWEGEVSRRQRALIAWGGVFAQGLALVIAEAAIAIQGPAHTPAMAQLEWAFTGSNLWLIALNLVPVPPLDGATAWPLIPMLWRDARAHWQQRKRIHREAMRARASAASRAQLRQLDALEDRGESAPEMEALKQKISLLGSESARKRTHE